MIVSSPNVGPDLNRFGPIGLVVVQSTSLCNLDCSYCYLPDRQKKRVFDLDLLPLLMQRILESPYAGPEIALVWHAAEPLTLPNSWYDEATDGDSSPQPGAVQRPGAGLHPARADQRHVDQ